MCGLLEISRQVESFLQKNIERGELQGGLVDFDFGGKENGRGQKLPLLDRSYMLCVVCLWGRVCVCVCVQTTKEYKRGPAPPPPYSR